MSETSRIVKLFYGIHKRLMERDIGHYTRTAFVGRAAEMVIRLDPKFMRYGLLGNNNQRPLEFMGFKLFMDESAPDPELIMFFVDGIHHYTANAQTLKVTETTPIEDPEDVWRFAAVANFMGNSDRVSPQTNRLMCYFPEKPGPTTEANAKPVELTTRNVNLDEMVERGILRRVDNKYDRVYAYTYAGRQACRAALQFQSAYKAKSAAGAFLGIG